MPTGWIDISLTLREGMVVWPGDEPVRMARSREAIAGGETTTTFFSMSAHTGTHVDAPRHYFRDGGTVEGLSLEATVGEARVLDFTGVRAVDGEALAAERIARGERILLKTDNSARWAEGEGFRADYACLTVDGAEYMAAAGVRAVGIDYLSIGAPGDEGDLVHRALLAAGVVVIEGLNLAAVAAGRYELICLPLKLAEGDGAPARAMLRPWRAD